jgi:hypothetical protein
MIDETPRSASDRVLCAFAIQRRVEIHRPDAIAFGFQFGQHALPQIAKCTGEQHHRICVVHSGFFLTIISGKNNLRGDGDN